MHESLAWPLEHAARPHGDRIAVIDGDRQLTYRELHGRIRRFGAGLDEHGIRAGASVGVLLNNSLEHVEAWLAVPAYGRVLNSLNTRLAAPELVFMAQDSNIELLIVDEKNLDNGRRVRDECPGIHALVFVGEGPCPEDCAPYNTLLTGEGIDPPDLAPDTIAVVMYTGGTTGRPKGVLLTHGNVLANSKHILPCYSLQREDRHLHAGPLFHIASAQMVHPVTWTGSTHIVLPRFSPAGFTAAVAQHRATTSVLVPTMIQMVLEHLEREAADLSSLRLLHYGASPMSAEMLRRAIATMGCEFLQGYGMTEASPGVTCLLPQDHRAALAGQRPERLKSVGHAIPGIQVQIRDMEGVPVPDGTVGEVWTRGPNIMSGYLNRPEETERALVGDWYRTGDAGYSDEDGYIFLVDRLKDMIITGGENVYSIEVERAIAGHCAVAEVAVIGLPDEQWGERVHAIVVPVADAALSAADVISHCRSEIAGYKVPKSVEIRDTPLPKSGAGKILKGTLRELAALSLVAGAAGGSDRAP